MANFQPRGISRRPSREVQDTRKPLYIIFILDTSSSMSEQCSVITPEGATEATKKINELNKGLKAALNSLRTFEQKNVLYKVYYQIIELNSYGKALFPDFVPLPLQPENISFEARGVTCLENSLSTLTKLLDPQHLPGCNRAVNVILMSDGYPTDVEGYVVEETVYKKTITQFKEHLETSGLKPNVDLYSIGVGNGACEEMLVTFADKDKYYVVRDMESLAQKLDFVTRQSLVRLTSRAVKTPEARELDREDQGLGTLAIAREVDVSKCMGSSCLACVDQCKLSAIRYENGMLVILPELCIGCGDCDGKCPVDAIHPIDEDGCDDPV